MDSQILAFVSCVSLAPLIVAIAGHVSTSLSAKLGQVAADRDDRQVPVCDNPLIGQQLTLLAAARRNYQRKCTCGRANSS